jgi:hypothetical protein
MLFKKKDGSGECPFAGFKPCRDTCVFYRRGMRYFEDSTKEPEEHVDCAINVMTDNLEQMHNKIYTLQKEMGETKNVMGYKVMMDMGLITKETAEGHVVKTLENSVDYTDGPTLIEHKPEGENTDHE